MNKTEAEYARQFLEPLKSTGAVIDYEHEAVKLRVGGEGERCWYTPDFVVYLMSGRVAFHEVKGGHVYDDARVKYLAAKRLYPWFDWVWAQKKGGVWARKGEPG